MNNFNIKSVHLSNFQLHENAVFNFTDQLTIITGETGTGKTCIFNAIRWVYGFSDIALNDFRKEGSDSTSVIVKLSSGFEIEKIRSNTVNRYILRKDGYEDKVFDSCGKDVPEEVRQVLGMYELEFDKISLNINFAEQDDLNFIFDSKIPASFNAKLFNKLTGNELLDKIFQVCNQEKLSIGKDLKVLEKQIIDQKESVESYTNQCNILQQKFIKVKDLYSQIEEQIIIYDELKKLASKLKINKDSRDFIQFKLDKIIIISDNTIKDLKEKAEQLKSMLTLQSKLTYVNQSLQEIKIKEKIIPDLNLEELTKQVQRSETLKNLNIKLLKNRDEQDKVNFLNSKLKIPNIDFENLNEDVLMLNELIKLAIKLSENKKGQEKVTVQFKNEQERNVTLESELKEIWDKNPTCPLCGQGVKNAIRNNN